MMIFCCVCLTMNAQSDYIVTPLFPSSQEKEDKEKEVEAENRRHAEGLNRKLKEVNDRAERTASAVQNLKFNLPISKTSDRQQSKGSKTKGGVKFVIEKQQNNTASKKSTNNIGNRSKTTYVKRRKSAGQIEQEREQERYRREQERIEREQRYQKEYQRQYNAQEGYYQQKREENYYHTHEGVAQLQAKNEARMQQTRVYNDVGGDATVSSPKYLNQNLVEINNVDVTSLTVDANQKDLWNSEAISNDIANELKELELNWANNQQNKIEEEEQLKLPSYIEQQKYISALKRSDSIHAVQMAEIRKNESILSQYDGAYENALYCEKVYDNYDFDYLRSVDESIPLSDTSRKALKDMMEYVNSISDDFNQKDGFSARLYYDKERNVYTLAFRGSESLRDYTKANLPNNFLGLPTSQFDKAADIAEKINKLPTEIRSRLVLTGHSLGGGLASLTASLTGQICDTYNAEGIPKRVLAYYSVRYAIKVGANPFGVWREMNANQYNIRAYNTDKDPLTFLQSGFSEGNSTIKVGNKRINLKDPAETRLIKVATALGQSVQIKSGTGHGITELIDTKDNK